MTVTLPVDLQEIEADIAQPCGAGKCDEQARWAYWATHTKRGCPGTSLLCDRHKDSVLAQWPRFLKSSRPCAICGRPKSGNVSDHVRFIPL